MFTKAVILFSAVAAVTLLTVQAKILRSSDTMERKEMCSQVLFEACPGSADVVPTVFPAEPEGFDEICVAASSHFPCFKNYASTCDTEDIDSIYKLLYLDFCDSSKPLYNGIRKSIRCIKKAERNFNATCFEPAAKLVTELESFGKKINDFSISADDWKKLELGLVVRMEKLCFLQTADECNEEFVSTVETIFDRTGLNKAAAVLLEMQATVEVILNALNLEAELKTKLKQG